jgi:hypothetical protein
MKVCSASKGRRRSLETFADLREGSAEPRSLGWLEKKKPRRIDYATNLRPGKLQHDDQTSVDIIPFQEEGV